MFNKPYLGNYAISVAPAHTTLPLDQHNIASLAVILLQDCTVVFVDICIICSRPSSSRVLSSALCLRQISTVPFGVIGQCCYEFLDAQWVLWYLDTKLSLLNLYSSQQPKGLILLHNVMLVKFWQINIAAFSTVFRALVYTFGHYAPKIHPFLQLSMGYSFLSVFLGTEFKVLELHKYSISEVLF